MTQKKLVQQNGHPAFSGVLAAHFATLLFGLAGLFGKWVKEPAQVIVFGRVFFASLSLALCVRLFHLRLKPANRSDGLHLFGLGALLAFHWVAFFHSIQVSTVAIGLLAYSTFPVFTTFLEPLWLKEKFRPDTLVGAAFCLFGVFWLVPSFNPTQPAFQGVFWGLWAGFSFALLSVANRRLARRYNSLVIAFYQDAGATIFLLPLVLLNQPLPSYPDLARLVFLGVICTAGAHSLFIQAMKKITAATAAVISSLEPVYGIILAFFLLKEIPSTRTVGGGIIILASVLLITWRSSKQPKN